MGRRVQYKGTDAALKGAATFKKGAAVLRPYKRIRVGGPCGQDSSGEWRVTRRRRTAKRSVGVVDGRGELAGSEGVEGAEAGVEFGGGEAALAVEPAEKIGGGTLAFERIAFEARGNQVAMGVAS